MQVYKDGQVAHYKDNLSLMNTSFPASGPSDDFLAANGAVKVSMFRDHDRATQKLVSCDPVVENGFAYVVRGGGQNSRRDCGRCSKQSCTGSCCRDRALEASDWRVIRAAETGVAMSQEWQDYRQSLRDLPNSEEWPNVELPHDPNYVPMGE
jgi:hypothetical protein